MDPKIVQDRFNINILSCMYWQLDLQYRVRLITLIGCRVFNFIKILFSLIILSPVVLSIILILITRQWYQRWIGFGYDLAYQYWILF